MRRVLRRAAAGPLLPAMLAAAPFLVMAARLVLADRDPVLSGDHAVLDLGTLDATRLHGSLGPYSRFVFRHPGPAFFYLLAPAMLATGRAPWALYLGVQLVYAATAAAMVGLVGRRAGPPAAAGTALVLLAYVAVLRPSVLAVPWNPLVIILPAALLLVATAAVSGPGPALAVVALTGTFLVQTHVSTGLLVAACWAAALVWALVPKRGGGDREPASSRRQLLTAGALAVVAGLLWVPPLTEQLTTEPGNAGLLVRFFLAQDHDPGPTPAQAAVLVGRELDISRGSIPYLGTVTPATVDRRRSLAALGLFLVAAVALVAGGRRAREPLAARLGITSLLGAAVAVVSVTRIVGETHWYLTAWMSAAVVPLLVGVVVLLARRLGGRGGIQGLLVGGTALASLALVAGVSTHPLYDSPAFLDEPRYRAAVEEAWRLVEPAVRAAGASSVAFEAASEAPSGPIAGVAARLERRGVHITVSDNLVYIYGEPHRRTGREDLRLAFFDVGAPPPAAAVPLGELRTLGPFEVYALH